MARDIEEFLRKAAERRKQQQGGAPPPQQPPARRDPPRPAAQDPLIIEDVEVVPEQRRVKPRVQKPRKKQSSIRNESVADHVKSHIDTSSIAQHAEQLGDRISSVHDQVDARINQRLNRDITAIDDTPSVTELPPPKIFGARSAIKAVELRKMLSDPRSVGQAILVAEILKRPNFD